MIKYKASVFHYVYTYQFPDYEWIGTTMFKVKTILWLWRRMGVSYKLNHRQLTDDTGLL